MHNGPDVALIEKYFVVTQPNNALCLGVQFEPQAQPPIMVFAPESMRMSDAPGPQPAATINVCGKSITKNAVMHHGGFAGLLVGVFCVAAPIVATPPCLNMGCVIGSVFGSIAGGLVACGTGRKVAEKTFDCILESRRAESSDLTESLLHTPTS
jgi:hypothetical protein